VGGLGEPVCGNLLNVPGMFGHPDERSSTGAAMGAVDGLGYGPGGPSLPPSLLPGVPLDESEAALEQEQLMMMMMMEEEQNSLKQQLHACCLRTIDILCVWDCCWCWVRVQELFALLVFDPFMELFITLCIVVNTLFMAMDHDDMDPDFNSVLKNGNLVRSKVNRLQSRLIMTNRNECQFFTSAFAIEAMMKLVALSPKFYFREGWNIFDFIIVVLSLLELGLDGVQGLSVLRTLRLVHSNN
jgi:hypothetical protein